MVRYQNQQKGLNRKATQRIDIPAQRTTEQYQETIP